MIPRQKQTVLLAEADSKQAQLHGQGEGQRILQAGLAEAAVLQRKVDSYGDPRLYSLAQLAAHLAKSTQPLVPEQLFINGGGGTSESQASTGVMGTLQALEVMKEILGIGESLAGHLLIYDALATRFRKLKVPPDPGCALCGTNPAIVSL